MTRPRTVAVLGAGPAGTAVARRLHAEGHRLVVVDRDVATARAAVEGLDGVHVAAVDLAEADAVRTWLDDVHAEVGRLDVVVHLVGGWSGGGAFGSRSLEHLAALEVPLWRTLTTVTSVVVDDLRHSDHGLFVMLSSTSVARPTGGNAAYAALKAAGEAWTQAMAHALKDTQSTAAVLRITALSPDVAGHTPVDVVAQAVVDLLDRGAEASQGLLVDLTREPYSTS